jgi:endo-1,4-beta-xylanase
MRKRAASNPAPPALKDILRQMFELCLISQRSVCENYLRNMLTFYCGTEMTSLFFCRTARNGARRFAESTFTAAVLLFTLFLYGCGGGSAGSSPNPPSSPSTPATTLRSLAAPHAILIGAAADSPLLSETNYASVLGSEFSQLQAENEMKFGLIHPQQGTYDFSGGDALVSFAQTHNMMVRGHTLVWYQEVPDWVTNGGFAATDLSNILQDHINTVMGHYAGKVYGWDVVNEAFNDDGTMRDTIWYDQPGIGFAGQGTKYIEQALQWAHAADPNAKLFYNDYNDETMNVKSDAIYAMAADFKNRGVPLDGIGFQTHVDLSFDNPNTLASYASNLQRFAALGLDVHITELDIRLSDNSTASLNAQAKLYGELMTMCVQQPRCKVFQTWGFTDKYSWIPGSFPGRGWALPFDDTYQKKPAYTAISNALSQ